MFEELAMFRCRRVFEACINVSYIARQGAHIHSNGTTAMQLPEIQGVEPFLKS
jgi:hypothetical protein